VKVLKFLAPLRGQQSENQVSDFPLWPSSSRKPRVLYEAEDHYHRLYDLGMQKTQMTDNPMRRMRHYTILQAVKNVAGVEGDACEAGCYRGLSAWLAAGAFARSGRKLTFHICDSFEGLSETKNQDKSIYSSKKKVKTFACDEDQVRANLSEFDSIEYHKGWIPTQFAALENCRFCYVHIDVDLYEPTRDSIEFLWPRLNKGGVMLLDDYATTRYPGAKQAIDEYFSDKSNYFLVERSCGQAIALKT
jgi:hypothetical protein